jgi:hypothetical protein
MCKVENIEGDMGQQIFALSHMTSGMYCNVTDRQSFRKLKKFS